MVLRRPISYGVQIYTSSFPISQLCTKETLKTEEPNGSSRNEVKCVAVICVISALPLKPRG